MIKLGILGAMEEEIETLLQRVQGLQKMSRNGSSFYEGSLEGIPVVISKCGIGKVNAAICAQVMCDSFHITHLVNTGIAGSLCCDLDIGDLVISSDAMYHDFDCTHFGYSYGQVPGTETPSFAADEALMAFAFTAADQKWPGKCRIGRVASGDQFVASQEKKDFIIGSTKALCTEMEGAAIAQAAWRNEIPYVIIRAISDKADDSAHMDYPAFEKMAADRCAELVCALSHKLFEEENS